MPHYSLCHPPIGDLVLELLGWDCLFLSLVDLFDFWLCLFIDFYEPTVDSRAPTPVWGLR